MRLAYATLFAVLALVATPAALAQSDDLVVVETGLGTITFELFDADAPRHAENIRTLADSGFYNSTIFHRIIPGFMIQGGDPNTKDGEPSTWGTGGPSGSVPAEFNDIRHERGIVSMARSANPDSAGSQFFIVHSPSLFLDGEYTVFGRIVTEESFETLDAIAALETNTRDQPTDVEKARVIGAYTIPRSEAGQLLELEPAARTPAAEPDVDESAPDERDAEPAPPVPPAPVLVDGVYTNKKLGVTLTPPEGWTLEEPRKTQAHIPDIVLIGSSEGAIPPNITLDIQYTAGRTLEEYVDERLALRSQAIESGSLVIESQEPQTVGGLEAIAVTATGTFSRNGTDLEVSFSEVALATDDKFYTFIYSGLADEFEGNEGSYDAVLDSFVPRAAAQSTAPGSEPASEQAEGGGCLVATAAYGTEMAHEIQKLREIRDSTVLATPLGAAFVSGFNDAYYAFSPTVADWERQSPEFRGAVRALITPMVSSLSIMSLADADSEASVALLGSLVIALNVGIYVAAPAALAWRLKR